MPDFENDYSLYKFVGPDNAFNYNKYRPEDLVELEGDNIVDVVNTILYGNKQLIKKEALFLLNKLGDAFHHKFKKKMYIQSSFRDFTKQDEIYSKVCKDKKCYTAKPGHSEHQTGFVLDVINAQTDRTGYKEEFDWLSKNAHFYGFHIPYQKGINIDGYPKESWHIRYFGQQFAKYLYKYDMTFTEFYKKETKIII